MEMGRRLTNGKFRRAKPFSLSIWFRLNPFLSFTPSRNWETDYKRQEVINYNSFFLSYKSSFLKGNGNRLLERENTNANLFSLLFFHQFPLNGSSSGSSQAFRAPFKPSSSFDLCKRMFDEESLIRPLKG